VSPSLRDRIRWAAWPASRRLQAAAAEPVQSQGRRLVGQTPIDSGNPRHVMVVGIGVNDIAENDVTDVFDIDSGAGHRFPHTRGRHLAGRGILQAAAVPADCRSNSAQNYYFSFHIKLGEKLLLLKNGLSLSCARRTG
jgi:hypothetical protein